MTRSLLALTLALAAAGCASAPPAPAAAAAAGPTYAEKIGWILRLEDARVLHDPAPRVAPPAPVTKGRHPTPPPPQPPDLVRLLSDKEARVRRRAALAVGRVGLAKGVDPLVTLLHDPEPEVRQMAAFALGLIGDPRARAPLAAALADPSPLVQGSAAEALGLIGDARDADAIGRMVAQIVQSGALSPVPGDADDARRDTPSSAVRLGIYGLVRLKAYPPLAAAVLDGAGQPRAAWWPVAFALARLADPRALPALRTLAKDANPYTRAFAVKGLGALKDRASVPTLLPLVTGADRASAIEAVRALGRIGAKEAAAPLVKIAQDPKAEPHLRLEAVTALASVKGPGVVDTLLDSLSDPSPAIRAAALKATAAADPDNFMPILSGLDPDPHWSVRAALASVLGSLNADAGLPRLRTLLADADQRVIPAALAALVELHPPDTAAILLARLKADDPVVRKAAAEGLGALKPPDAARALADAYTFGQRDTTYVARAAALDALTKYGAAAATPVLDSALGDKDWAVRVHAAALLKTLDPTSEVSDAIRPAPTSVPATLYEEPRLVDPQVSTEVYIDTDRGSIQIELAVLDAPLTVENFVALARKGFFNGLAIHRVVPDFVVQGGDPRGDGEGGPGYTIRDEINERPYLRGTVGMALDWADTGGSQFFITHSPQPHLDAKYTVFGRVIGGMDVVDSLRQWDVIRRVRVWDGNQMTKR